MATALGDCDHFPVFRMDDERDLTNAIEKAFPNCHCLTCTCHLRENCNRQLQHTLGHNDKARNAVIRAVFGEHRLAYVTDEVQFDVEQQTATEIIQTTTPNSVTYFNTCIVPKLFMNLQTKQLTGLPDTFPSTNNNTESANHILCSCIVLIAVLLLSFYANKLKCTKMTFTSYHDCCCF